MKKHLYSLHDELAKFYNPLQVSDLDPEAFKVNLERSIRICKDPIKLHSLEQSKLCYIGCYDDTSMIFSLLGEPQVILDCGKVVENVLSIYEQNK